ncbi:hypothetical protein E2C01_097628 [Portunus trituberculatus]|uniref:Uncharacterized protein n=1 Tax=Portunus trituberculatus TaxID=210409 RepID=A0A5B7K0W4_PORTR|nr:hypothetical protein [Portunus trituberculatus]
MREEEEVGHGRNVPRRGYRRAPMTTCDHLQPSHRVSPVPSLKQEDVRSRITLQRDPERIVYCSGYQMTPVPV